MAEWEAWFSTTESGTKSGFATGEIHTSFCAPRYADDTKTRTRCTRETMWLSQTEETNKSGFATGPELNSFLSATEEANKSGFSTGTKRTGYTFLPPDMFTERDRIPRIGIHQTITGYGIADCDVLISGKLGITTAAKTDGRGVWWAYLPVDDYSNASIRSFVMNGGKVYEMLEQTERDEGYIWDEVMKCITRTGNGYRMISRMV